MGKATHSSILAWRIPWGREELDTTEPLSLSLFSLREVIYTRVLGTHQPSELSLSISLLGKVRIFLGAAGL